MTMINACYVLIPLAVVGLALIVLCAYLAAVLLVEAWKK
jgi:hypothetical protein